MDFKILKTSSKYPDVLIYRTRDEDGNEQVFIHSFGTNAEKTQDEMNNEVIEFQSPIVAQNFIKDFSINSAEEWCKEQAITA